MKRQSTEIKVEAALTGGINDNTREREREAAGENPSLWVVVPFVWLVKSGLAAR
jgi:hypothetical protein